MECPYIRTVMTFFFVYVGLSYSLDNYKIKLERTNNLIFKFATDQHLRI